MKKVSKKKFKRNNKGFGVIEVVLLIIVVIALVLIFQDEVTAFVQDSLDYLEPASDQIFENSEVDL